MVHCVSESAWPGCSPGPPRGRRLLQNYSSALTAAGGGPHGQRPPQCAPVLREGWLAREREGQCRLGLHPSLPESSCTERVPAGLAGPLEFAERAQQVLSPVCNTTVLGFPAPLFRCCFPKRGAPRPPGEGTGTSHGPALS